MSVKQLKGNFSFLDGESISYSVQIYSHGCDIIFILILATASAILFVSSLDKEARIWLHDKFSWHSPLNLSEQILIKLFVMR